MTSLVRADDPPYRPRIVPQCTKYKLKDGTEICGYENVEDWKKVLEADAELVLLRETAAKKGDDANNLAQQVLTLRGQVDACTDNVKILVTRNEKVTNQLIDLDKKYQDERVKPQWGSWVSWGLAAVSTSILAGVLIKSTLDR